VSAPFAGTLYGLTALAEGVGDNPAAETRFVLVSAPTAPPAATGADKTSLVLYIGQDHPGALLEILTEFAVRGINLTRIESRPTGGGIGDYFFSIDCEGHVDDARVGEGLMGLRRVCAEVRFLGSFPRVDGVRPTLRRGVSDTEYHDAQAWLARVREGRA
jgi:prephenate dehydratase